MAILARRLLNGHNMRVAAPDATPPVVPQPTVSPGQANRFDLTLLSSVAAPGAAIPGSVMPNGTFPAGTITLAGTNGTCTPSSFTLTAGSTTPLSYTYTPTAAGEHMVTATNTAGLFNPYGAPLNVFTPGAGASQGLSATLKHKDQVVYQRDTPVGSPTGFSIANTKGWGEVWINVTAAVPALFAKLYDSQSNGATTTVGTGTELTTGWVQVHGPVGAAGVVRLLLPAVRAKMFYMDLSTDSAGTQPMRIVNRFKVGHVICVASRSQLTGWMRGYAEGTNDAPSVPYTQASVSFSPDYRYGNDGTWYRIDGNLGDPSTYNSYIYGEACSNGTMEAGRLIDQQLGTMLGLVGTAATSGGLDQFINTSGALQGGARDTPPNANGGKYRWLVIAATARDGAAETADYYQQTYAAALTALPVAHPACAVIAFNTGATGRFGNNGSYGVGGYTRNQMFWVNAEQTNPMVASQEDHNWNAFATGHATQAARLHWMREHIRLLLAAEQVAWGGYSGAHRGPTLSATGTMALGSGIIRIPFKLNGGTTLQCSMISFQDATHSSVSLGTGSSTDLMGLFGVYNAGGKSGAGTVYQLSGAAINTTSPPSGFDGTIDLTLTSGQSVPSSLTVHALSDFGVSGGSNQWAIGTGGIMPVLHNNDDPLGVGIGAHMRPQLDIAISPV